jgi:hypothetical protein
MLFVVQENKLFVHVISLVDNVLVLFKKKIKELLE